MEAVYVLEPGSYIRREGMTLKVVKAGKVLEQIPADGLKRLMLVGYVSLTGGVLDFLIRNRVETVFMTPTGRYRARLTLDEQGHVALRRSQYLQLSRKEFALETARTVVSGKIRNMLRLTLLRARQYGDETLKIAAASLNSASAHVKDVKEMDGLRGVEGAATRAYFSAFNQMLRNEAFSFKGRNRRPPLDPVNALLSFVYTLLTNEVLSAIQAGGLDPYLGALHEPLQGRPSLACDLVEEYRTFLGDRLVLGLINRKVIGKDDFVYGKKPPLAFVDEEEMRRKRPVLMKPAICRAFIQAYEEMMKRDVYYPPLDKNITYRWLILQQARRFGNYLKAPEKEYLPFTWDA